MMPLQLEITVTASDFNNAEMGNPGKCAIAFAIKRLYPHLDRPFVSAHRIAASDAESDSRYEWHTPDQQRDWILLADNAVIRSSGQVPTLYPFTLRRRDARKRPVYHYRANESVEKQEARLKYNKQRTERLKEETKPQRAKRDRARSAKMHRSRRGYAEDIIAS
jgi:hypothetical protein